MSWKQLFCIERTGCEDRAGSAGSFASLQWWLCRPCAVTGFGVVGVVNELLNVNTGSLV